MDAEAAHQIAKTIVDQQNGLGAFRRDLMTVIQVALMDAYAQGDANGYARHVRQSGRTGFAPGPQLVRHNVRGTEYEVIGVAKGQVSKPDMTDGCRTVRDGSEVQVYRSLDDHQLYFRFPDEFEDGRFTTIVARSPEHGVNARQVALQIVLLSVFDDDEEWVREKWKGEIDAAEALIRNLLREKIGIPAGWRLVPGIASGKWSDTWLAISTDDDDGDIIRKVLDKAPTYPLPITQHQTAHRFSVVTRDDVDSDPRIDPNAGHIIEHSIAIFLPGDTDKPSVEAHIGAGERYRRIAERICAVLNRAVSGN